ncbi:MAG TPA: radical SAM protein, partial [Bacillota bacterium]|nr:radical SAM protein [Bacillota bacterium]
MRYEGLIYRPPSEARSLIIQITVGCSHNRCRFCSMYKDKVFRVRKAEEIERDLVEMSRYYPNVKRIFLADGDALCLAGSKLLRVLGLIKDLFPKCERVSIYG